MATPRKILCAVSEIVPHGDRVYTLRLSPDKPLPVFKAGQFLHLAIDSYDPSGFWPDSRAFSIASSPVRKDCLEVVYSVVGRFTGRMEKELKVGSQVWVKLPYGEFVVDASQDLVLIAGGTGVTAYISFLRGLGASSSKAEVKLVYGARKAELLLYKSELDACARANSKFSVSYLSENGALGDIQSGRISLDHIWNDVPRVSSRIFYLSGPPTMIKALSEQLRGRGVAEGQIRIDAWE